MRRILSKSIGILMLAGVAACDAADPLEAPASSQPPSFSSDVEMVTYGLARALQSADNQAFLRDRLRESPWVEHKLLLQEFLLAESATPLFDSMAKELATSTDSLRSLVEALPEMDLYMPRQHDRRSWQVGDSMVVLNLRDLDGDNAFGFTFDGRPTSYLDTSSDAAILMLHDAERKGRRIHAQADVPGQVVEDQNDGTLSLVITTWHANGSTSVVDYADLPYAAISPIAVLKAADLTPDLTSSFSLVGSTELEFIQPFFDDGLAGQCEGRTENYFVPVGTTKNPNEHTTWSAGGLGCTVTGVPVWDMQAIILNQSIEHVFGAKVAIQLWEDDSWPNGDDNYGWFDFFYATRDGAVGNGYATVGLESYY